MLRVIQIGCRPRVARILNKRFLSSGLSADTHGIIPKIASVSRLANFKLSFPQLVVVGNQSGGKSSVLDGLMGEDILPKGDTMVTRRPIQVSLVRDTSKWGRVDGGRVLTMHEMRKQIAVENKDLDFTDVPLNLELHSPDVFDLNLVDLPGYIVTVKEGQDPDLPSKIRSLCAKYLQDPQNIILCVASASADIATSVAIGEAQKYDEDHDRTLGILTKIDIGKPRAIRRILANQEYKLPLGYIGVRCRTFEELQSNMSFNELIKTEANLIKKRGMSDLRVGLPLLRQSLSDLLLHRVMQFFPDLLEKIDSSIENKTRNTDLLDQLYKHRDLEAIAKKLEHLVTHFHINSPSRLQLEIACRKKLHKMCDEAVDKVSKEMVDEVKIQTEVEKIESGQEGSRPYKGYRWRNARGSYYNEDSPRTKTTNADIMNDLMLYGHNTPKHISNEKLRELSDNMLRAGVVSRHFYPYIPEDYHIDKGVWHHKLDRSIDQMLEGGLAENTRQEMINILIGFVKGLSDQKDKDSELARFFFEYLIQQVNERTDYQQVSEQICFMINREKRPQSDYYTMLKKIWDYLDEHHLRLFDKGWLMTDVYDYKFPIYGHIWTLGYLRSLRDRLGDDIYRVFAVNVIDTLIFETLHNSLKLFKSGRIFREAKRQLAEQQKLEAVRKDLVEFQETHGEFMPMTYQPVPVTVNEELDDDDDSVEVQVTARRRKRGRKPKSQ